MSEEDQNQQELEIFIGQVSNTLPSIREEQAFRALVGELMRLACLYKRVELPMRTTNRAVTIDRLRILQGASSERLRGTIMAIQLVAMIDDFIPSIIAFWSEDIDQSHKAINAERIRKHLEFRIEIGRRIEAILETVRQNILKEE